MKNTPENKAKFFAQYWGQRIWRYNHTTGEKALLYINATTIENKKHFGFGGFLELKPLSQITDEDAIEVAKLSKSFFDDPKIWGRTVIKSFTTDCSSYSASVILNIEHYLRSKGYALPWMGISVEQQIEWEWVKLTETPLEK